MSSEPLTPPPEAAPENLVEVGVYGSYADAFEHGLVVLAMGLPCWVEPVLEQHRLLVGPLALEDVLRQLRAFDRERVGWPPKPVDDPAAHRHVELLVPVLWVLAVIVAFWTEVRFPGLVRAGELNGDAIRSRGEWWRCVTALFLHADTPHLVSNAVSGLAVFSAATTLIGRARGWLQIAAGAVLGNATAVLVHGRTAYHSIGASTAVFAAVGVLTGRALRRMSTQRRAYRIRAMFAPLAAGITVLTLYGAGGVQVDVLAHATGFISGVFTGALGARFTREPDESGPGRVPA